MPGTLDASADPSGGPGVHSALAYVHGASGHLELAHLKHLAPVTSGALSYSAYGHQKHVTLIMN